MAQEAKFDDDIFGGVSQERFLAELRRRMDRGKPPEGHPGSLMWPEGIEANFSLDQKAERFVQEWTALGGEAARLPSVEDAYERVQDILARRGINRILLGGGDWNGIERGLRDRGIKADRWDAISFERGGPDRELDRVNAWGAGLVWVDYAVAELGSVAICSSPSQGRSVSLAPPFFVALIRPDRLFWTRRAVLEDVARRHREEKGPSSLTFITGPSRSADIEMDLAIGVHGPGDVLAVIAG